MNPLRNLLVIGLNHLVTNNLIELDSSEDAAGVNGHVLTEIEGKKSVIMWSSINCDEIRVSVWWDYLHESHPQANLEGSRRESFRTSRPLAKKQHYSKFVGATVSGWLERETGKFLQGYDSEGLFDTYVRRTNKEALNKIPITEGIGFNSTGKYFA